MDTGKNIGLYKAGLKGRGAAFSGKSECTGSGLRCCNPNCRKLTTKIEAASRNFNVGRCGHCGSKLFETPLFDAKPNRVIGRK